MDVALEASAKPERKLSFEDVYLANRKLMTYTAMNILHNFADAEDCVSEAFLRFSKNFEKYSRLERPKLTSLLVIIVRNAALDRYRENQRTIPSETPDIDAGAVSLDEYPYDSVVSAIKLLKDEYRDVLMLRYVYGYSVVEISSLLKISPDNVYKRVQRARSALAKILEEGGGEK